MDKHEFDKAVLETAKKLLRRKLLVFSVVSLAMGGAIVAVVVNRLINSISTDEDWSDVDWALDENEECELM